MSAKGLDPKALWVSQPPHSRYSLKEHHRRWIDMSYPKFKGSFLVLQQQQPEPFARGIPQTTLILAEFGYKVFIFNFNHYSKNMFMNHHLFPHDASSCDSLNESWFYSINFMRACSLSFHQFNIKMKNLCSWTDQSLVKNLWKPSTKIIFLHNSSLL